MYLNHTPPHATQPWMKRTIIISKRGELRSKCHYSLWVKHEVSLIFWYFTIPSIHGWKFFSTTIWLTTINFYSHPRLRDSEKREKHQYKPSTMNCIQVGCETCDFSRCRDWTGIYYVNQITCRHRAKKDLHLADHAMIVCRHKWFNFLYAKLVDALKKRYTSQTYMQIAM